MAAKKRRGLIIGAAPWKSGAFLIPYLAEDNWTVFCADGGYAHAVKAGFHPDFLIGDWDSGARPCVDIPCVTLPAEKDMTDLQAAADQALRQGITELLLCGCTGGRLDHTVSNFSLLEWIARRGGQGLIVDEDNDGRLLGPGHYILPNHPAYRYVSLIPVDEHISGVTMRQVKYPLEQAELVRGDTLTVSNEPLGAELELSIAAGRVWLIRSQRLK